MLKRKFLVLRNKEDGDGGSSGGGGAGAAGAAGNAGTGAAGAGAAVAGGAGAAGSDAGAAGEQSLFAQVGAGGQVDSGQGDTGAAAGAGTETPEQIALNASEKDTRRPPHVPAKFWNAEKGEINAEAWGNSTKALESRMKDIGLPPKSADEYKFDPPAAFKDAGLDLDPAMAKQMRDDALAQGLTQKQYEWIMGKYYSELEGMVNMSAKVGGERLKADLMGHYKTPEAMQQNVSLALSVVKAFGDEAELAAAMGPQGNTPAWVYRVLAKVGKELREDPGAQNDGILAQDDIGELMRGKPGDEDAPYWNPQHPQHKSVVAKVQRHHEAQSNARKRKAA